MYRRLILFGLAVCASALIALVVPLGLAARDIVHTQHLSSAAAQARAVANQWQQDGGKHGDRFIDIPPSADEGTVTLFNPKKKVRGENPPAAQRVVQAAFKGATASEVVDGWGYVTTPAYFDDEFGVVLVSLDPDEMGEGLLPRLGALAAVSALLLGLAGAAAWLLARRTVAPLRALEETANAVAAGDLQARAEHSSITEIENVGVALNRVTERVEELLHEEREYTAALAHQLRTPLTALSVDVDAVSDPVIREQLNDDLLAVHRMVDEIITTARRATREGLQARCDAGAVVRDRVRFWAVLAEDQHREFHTDIADVPTPVRLTADDLASALDILFQNVFLHSEEGTEFGVEVAPVDGFVDVTVWDKGPGFDQPDSPGSRVGSTQLGLSIADRLCDASGGELIIRNDSGARVTLRLGPPGA